MGYVTNFIIIEICKTKFIFEIDKLLKQASKMYIEKTHSDTFSFKENENNK